VDVRIGSLTHTFVGDLRIDLISPDGTSVNLVNRPGGVNNGGNDFTDTVFDDEAALRIGSGGTSAPYTGSFRPQSDQLSRFDEGPQQGTWKLRLVDFLEPDPGTLQSWGVDSSPADCGAGGSPPTPQAPPPGSPAPPANGDGPAAGAPESPALPKLDLTAIPGTVRVGRRGRFRLFFRGTPATAGEVSVRTVRRIAVAGARRRLTLAAGAFRTGGASGDARVTLRLRRRALRALRRARRLRVTVTARLASLTATRVFRLKAPRPRR
jgi:hypothetical protein